MIIDYINLPAIMNLFVLILINCITFGIKHLYGKKKKKKD